ncbi:MAG: hypothetical protein ACRBCJ_07065 [Hyphomicrobiaceae bacterium]
MHDPISQHGIDPLARTIGNRSFGCKHNKFAYIIALAMALSGCANGSTATVTTNSGLRCVDDSSHCIKQRQYALNAMLSDPANRWVHQTVSADAYASGVRLFAFKKKKKQLPCGDLRRGHQEAQNARTVLNGPSAKHLSSGQIARGAMLGTEVARELKREIRRRCGKA